MTKRERLALMTALLKLSGRHPRRDLEPRCLEVMVFDFNGEGIRLNPAQAEMVYGEWLRGAFENGEMPSPLSDSENTLILAQARENAFPLFGPEAEELLPEVSASTIRSAMRDEGCRGRLGLSTTSPAGGLDPRLRAKGVSG
jgi:streptomycin 3"-adenylyltransferase